MSERFVVDDLMKKVADDVTDAISRSLALTDEHLPVATAAAAAAITAAAAVMELMKDEPPGDRPDPDCLLLAALICARTGMRDPNPVRQAYSDLEILKTAGVAHA